MTVRVGVIGVGNIGQQHVQTLRRLVAGAGVVAVSDADSSRAASVASGLSGARVYATGQELIRADEVDAVVVASWGATHEEFVVASIAAGKPVFCEKPLAPTTAACLRILAAEMARQRRLVQVGFMRRYDGAYRALKRSIGALALGRPLMVHCAHRNQGVPPHYTGEMTITDTAIHEIDVVRWLLDEEIVAVRVLQPRKTSLAPAGLPDPLLVVLEMASGVIVDVEVFVTLPYGYEIRCEVVCEFGTAALAGDSPLLVRKDGRRSDVVAADFQERFSGAYQVELQEWVAGIERGVVTGPTAWDGYAAAAAADSCLVALQTGEPVPVRLIERPAFYGAAA